MLNLALVVAECESFLTIHHNDSPAEKVLLEVIAVDIEPALNAVVRADESEVAISVSETEESASLTAPL